MFLKLATQSLISRRGSVLLTVLAMTVSIFVLLGVEHIRHQSKESFANTVSGVDLIVGARTGSLNLLLYSVFRVGAATNNIDWDSYQEIASDPKVKWAIPISLGDSHKGYRVMGTTPDYFEYFSYGNKRKLEFASGRPFKSVFGVVLGSEVAAQLGYSLDDKLVLAHGIAATSFSMHEETPFTVVGILKPTGTPVDQTLHVGLDGIEAIHVGWQQGVKMPGQTPDKDQLAQMEFKPESITAFMLGLNSRMAMFGTQRAINNYSREPLMAIMPGVALSELWQMMRILEDTLRLISILILISALAGLSAMLLASIRERNHEIQLLRVIGAPPAFLFLLIELEAVLISALSILLGIGLLSLCIVAAQEFLAYQFGLHITAQVLSQSSLIMLALVVALTLVAAAVPSLNAYRNARLSYRQ